MNEDISAIQSEPLDEPSDTVSVSFKSITFSDDTTVPLDPTDIVVLVGPNNAGKSAALRELSDVFARNRRSTVLSYAPTTIGTKQEFEQYVKKHAQIRLSNGMWSVSGYKLNQVARRLDLESFWPDNLESFKSLFCLEMFTETRIKDSDPPAPINVEEEPTTHPIHLLIEDDTLEFKVSDHFYRAFQSDLILDRTVAKTVSLLVGIRPIVDKENGEDRVSKTYRDKVHKATVPLAQQGDGIA